MVTFTHEQAGTDERAWAAADWARLPALDLTGVERVLVVAAHPDDESLGAGGLIALAAARRIPVRIVVATNGDASHPRSPTHTPARLAEIRGRELHEAARLLGTGIGVRQLGLPDGALAGAEDTLRADLTATLRELGGPGTLVVAPWQHDGHADHDAAGRAASDAALAAGARLIEYPVWLWHWASPPSDAVPWARMARLELSREVRAAKRAAIRTHTSQVAPLSPAEGDEVLLTPEFLAHFDRSFEVYVADDAHADRAQTPGASLDLAYFDEFYEAGPDPWGYETRWYEQRKRDVTLAALPRPRYRRALELGCSIGVLTQALAGRCDEILGVDVADAPLRRARERLSGRSDIAFSQYALPHEWPEGRFDLIVMSEVGYYWDAPDLDAAITQILASLTPDGVLVACHWRHPVADYPRTGDAVHAQLALAHGLVRTVHHLEEDFVLEIYRRPPGSSVARETGLV